jgi:uncharacterized protein (DUF697 family)
MKRRMSAEDTDLSPTAAPEPWCELVLLGKTGTGKSALFRALTGLGEVGEGFRPGTRQPVSTDLPAEAPVLRLTEWPGLTAGAAPPAARPGLAWLAVARLDDPVQAPLAEALRAIRRADRAARILLALTGAERLPDPAERARAAGAIRAALEAAAGGPLPAVELALRNDGTLTGRDQLAAALATLLPDAAAALARSEDRAAEARAFARHRALIRRHALGAGAADVLPAVGLVGVPAAQAAMLAALARAMGLGWTPARAAAFAAALGAGVLVRQGAALAARQGLKAVPVVGQTLGAAAAGAISAAATWALGRAAHAWLWGQARGAPPDRATLRALYARALAEGMGPEAG